MNKIQLLKLWWTKDYPRDLKGIEELIDDLGAADTAIYLGVGNAVNKEKAYRYIDEAIARKVNPVLWIIGILITIIIATISMI